MLERLAALVLMGLGWAGSASAVTLLTIDLSIQDQMTITATDGLADATITDSDQVGIYLAGIFGSAFEGPGVFGITVSGDLVSAQDAASGFPLLFADTAGGEGLNIWNYANGDQSTFIAGEVAFSGSATWQLDPSNGAYQALLNGTRSGDIYFATFSDAGIPDAVIIGQWEVAAVPLPAAFWLFATALAGVSVLRRKAPSSA